MTYLRPLLLLHCVTITNISRAIELGFFVLLFFKLTRRVVPDKWDKYNWSEAKSFPAQVNMFISNLSVSFGFVIQNSL